MYSNVYGINNVLFGWSMHVVIHACRSKERSRNLWSSPPPYLLLAPKPGLLVSTALKIGVNYYDASGGAGILDSGLVWELV
jgi:hypothetical protein